MVQDNPNDTLQVEEPQTSTRVPDGVTPAEQSAEPRANALVAEPIMNDVKGDTEASAMDEEEDEIPDAESEESEDQDDEAGATESASNAKEAATAQQPNAPSAKSEEETDERCGIEKEPYDFDYCTVQIALQLLPNDGDPNGRRVIVGVRSLLDAPILRFLRLNELGALPPLVNTLLDELKSELPAREQAARTALEKKREEKAKRKAEIASRTKSPQRGKKMKATTLATAPAAAATDTDNRPRPNVTVPTNTQQQMGLF